MKREEILNWFKRYFIDLWKDHDTTIEGWEEWRPTRTQKITSDMDSIAKRCRGAGEQAVFRYCKKTAENLLERAEERERIWGEDRGYTWASWRFKMNDPWDKNWMWHLKRHWIQICVENFSMEEYKWREVTIPQIERMKEKLKSDPEWTESLAEEWAASCIAQARWWNPQEALPDLQRFEEREEEERMARAFANASTEEISDPEEEEPDQRPKPKGWLYRRKRF